MKNKLIAIILAVSLVACVEHKDVAPIQETSTTENISLTSSEQDLDFEYIYMETRGKQRFSRTVTKEEETAFYNRTLEATDRYRNADRTRFNRKIIEPILEPDELKKREQIIERLLKKCARLIGKEHDDRDFRLDLKEGDIFFIAIIKTPDPEYIRRTQPSYLTGHMQKCTRYLYPANPITSTPYYNFSDFEYQNNDSSNTQNHLKKQKIEKLYEQIYLEIKQAGLLRQIFYTYYPKSFLREHADQTGLTKFIQEKEVKAGSPLKHDELATEFFGSREEWIKSFDQFLDRKINAPDFISKAA